MDFNFYLRRYQRGSQNPYIEEEQTTHKYIKNKIKTGGHQPFLKEHNEQSKIW